MEPKSLLLAGLLSAGAHTAGHVREGGLQGVPVSVDGSRFVEHWNTNDPKKALRIHGAGFRAQDEVGRHTDNTKIESEYRLSNGLYKLGYLLGSAKLLTKEIDGDIKSMEKLTKDKNITKFGLLVSALSDIHKAGNPDRKFNIEFWQSQDGTPGLAINIPLK